MRFRVREFDVIPPEVNRAAALAVSAECEKTGKWSAVGCVGLFISLWEERHCSRTLLTSFQLTELTYDLRNIVNRLFDGATRYNRMAELVRVLMTSPKLRWVNRPETAVTNPNLLCGFVMPEAERLRTSDQRADREVWSAKDRVSGSRVVHDW